MNRISFHEYHFRQTHATGMPPRSIIFAIDFTESPKMSEHPSSARQVVLRLCTRTPERGKYIIFHANITIHGRHPQRSQPRFAHRRRINTSLIRPDTSLLATATQVTSSISASDPINYRRDENVKPVASNPRERNEDSQRRSSISSSPSQNAIP